MNIQFLMSVVLCLLLTKKAGGERVIQQNVKNQDSTSYMLVAVSVAPKDIAEEENHSENPSYDGVGVKLPDVPCSENNPCSRFNDPLLECVNGECSCIMEYCWVYHLENSGWTSKNVFSCGICGQFGSWCNETITCDVPGLCYSDGYCHCPEGEHASGICVVVDDSSVYKFALLGFGFIFLTGLFIMGCYFFKNRPWTQPGPWCCRRCRKGRGSGSQEGSCEKTPAFTVQSRYLNTVSAFDTESLQESYNGSGDPSTSSHISEPSVSYTKKSTEGDSIHSEDTGYTSISGDSTPKRRQIISPESDHSSEGACSLYIETLDDANIKACQENSKEKNYDRTVNLLQTKLDHNESDSSSYNDSTISRNHSSSTHERCQLCLPKGLSARSKINVPREKGPGKNPVMEEVQPPLHLLEQASNNINHSENSNFECTQL